jgi:hypothetical protein
MSNKQMVVVREETHEADAQIVVGFLRGQGIEAMISEDDAGDQIPSLELARGVKIFVPVEDAERAREILEEQELASDADEP